MEEILLRDGHAWASTTAQKVVTENTFSSLPVFSSVEILLGTEGNKGNEEGGKGKSLAMVGGLFLASRLPEVATRIFLMWGRPEGGAS